MRCLLVCMCVSECTPVSVCSCARDFYKILNVPRHAKTNEIKRAYRSLAKQLHPDKNREDPNAEDRFRDLNEAYETLSDTEKRGVYDQHGEEGLKQRFGGGGESHDPFASFFGDVFFGAGGHRGGGERETPKGGEILMDLDVALEELYNGNFIQVLLSPFSLLFPLPSSSSFSSTHLCSLGLPSIPYYSIIWKEEH